MPTESLPHQIDGPLSIDHIAVPADATVSDSRRIAATGLSDHDVYLIDATS